ncbi:hypothetical protein IWX87_000136 [Polaromonas sp. CG_9.7]|nr:hypothetical protein [Polaromonas sp. CG_9.7]MBG6112394.1 hypothetical protein [Polaromonas sp. CG_9.2]MDH6184041.1 hypothetical protein [Polaromonas sp. CG_23.6]
MLHGQERDVFADAGYQGLHKRPDAKHDVTLHVAMRPAKRRALDKVNKPIDALIDKAERCLRYRTCGWCAINYWLRRNMCACKPQKGFKTAANAV